MPRHVNPMICATLQRFYVLRTAGRLGRRCRGRPSGVGHHRPWLRVAPELQEVLKTSSPLLAFLDPPGDLCRSALHSEIRRSREKHETTQRTRVVAHFHGHGVGYGHSLRQQRYTDCTHNRRRDSCPCSGTRAHGVTRTRTRTGTCTCAVPGRRPSVGLYPDSSGVSWWRFHYRDRHTRRPRPSRGSSSDACEQWHRRPAAGKRHRCRKQHDGHVYSADCRRLERDGSTDYGEPWRTEQGRADPFVRPRGACRVW